jgi:phasin
VSGKALRRAFLPNVYCCGRFIAVLRCTIQCLCEGFALLWIRLAATRRKNPTIAQGNSPDFTIAPRMIAMTAYVQNQAPKVADAPQVFRDVAEKGSAQAKENFEKMSVAAGDVTNQMKNVYSTTFKGAQDYTAKVLEFAHVNINAAFEHAKKLSSVKSPAEFFALSNDHMRQQFEALSRQAQELAAITQKTTAATTESVKASVQKAA